MLIAKAERVLGSGKARKGGAALLILLAALLSWSAASRMSVTIDEFQTIPAGLAMLETGEYRYPVGTPPLSQLLPALPIWMAGARVEALSRDTSLSSWGLAHEFAVQEGTAFPRLFEGARLVSTAAFMLLLALLFGYARSLYGERAALFSLAVAALCPNLLAHGSLLTPDIYLAAAVVGFLWSLDVVLERPSMASMGALGVSLGVAASVKFTGLLLLPLMPMLALGRRKRYLFGAMLVACLVINVVYVFDGSFTSLSQFAFESSYFRRIQAHIPLALPVPFPFYFVHALDQQFAELPYPAYLLGNFNLEGFYLYYLVAFLVKTPVATLLLALLAWYARPRAQGKELRYLACGAFLLVFFSLGRHKNIGLRYLLFMFPLLALWCGRPIPRRPAWLNFTRVGLLTLLLLESLSAWPDYIAFFNFASGGTSSGHRYLLDSNLDWGQGLLELRDYLAGREVSLAYAGRVRPELYGIHYETLRAGAEPTKPLVAISANLLWGRGYFVNGTSYWPKDHDAYVTYRTRMPLAVLGGSIYVYER